LRPDLNIPLYLANFKPVTVVKTVDSSQGFDKGISGVYQRSISE
jgi:hypothetical protein